MSVFQSYFDKSQWTVVQVMCIMS